MANGPKPTGRGIRSAKQTVQSLTWPLPVGSDEWDDLDLLAGESAPSQPSHQEPMACAVVFCECIGLMEPL